MTVPTTHLAMVMAGPGEMPVPTERPIPAPGGREVLVRVGASSLNFHDLVNLMGLIKGPWPRVPMSDGAGTIVAVGDEVAGLAVGDRVIGAFHPAWLDGPPTPGGKRVTPGDTCDGWLQQYGCRDAASVIPVPAHLSDVEAATLPCAGTTAWSALQAGGVGPGDIVVTQGTGGVSILAVQLAAALGATVIVTSSSDTKLDVARSLGATHGVNYLTTPEWQVEVRRLTDGRGADLVLDVGGQDTLGRSVKATCMGGTVAVIGVLSGFGSAQVPVADTMLNNIHLVGITVGSVAAHTALCASVAAAGIHPHVSRVFGWEELPEAMRVMQAGEHTGKIGLTIP